MWNLRSVPGRKQKEHRLRERYSTPSEQIHPGRGGIRDNQTGLRIQEIPDAGPWECTNRISFAGNGIRSEQASLSNTRWPVRSVTISNFRISLKQKICSEMFLDWRKPAQNHSIHNSCVGKVGFDAFLTLNPPESGKKRGVASQWFKSLLRQPLLCLFV